MAKEKIASGFVEVTAPMGEFIKNLQRGDTAFASFFSSVSGMASKIGIVIGGIGVGLGALAVIKTTLLSKSFVEIASASEEMQRRAIAAFANTSVNIQQWAKTTASATGLVSDSLLELAGQFQRSFRVMGLGVEQSATLSVGLAKLAAQIANVTNESEREVFLKLSSAMRGAGGSADEQAAAMLRLRNTVAPYLDTAAALTGQTANYTRVTLLLSKAVLSLSKNIGSVMLPVFQTLKVVMLVAVNFVNLLAGAFAALPRPLKFMIGSFSLLIGVVGPGLLLFKLLKVVFIALQPQIAIVSAHLLGLTGSAAAAATGTAVLRFSIQRLLASLPGIGLVLLGLSILGEGLFLFFGKGASSADDLAESVGDIEERMKGLNKQLGLATGNFVILGSLAKRFGLPKFPVPEQTLARAGPTTKRPNDSFIISSFAGMFAKVIATVSLGPVLAPIIGAGGGDVIRNPTRGVSGKDRANALATVERLLTQIRDDRRRHRGLN